jgi:hypothetical protein
LKLNREEETMFEQEVKRLNLRDEANLELFWTDWHEKGEHKALANVALRQLHRRLGQIPDTAAERIQQLETPLLEKLTDDLLDFININQLEAWLEHNQPLAAK